MRHLRLGASLLVLVASSVSLQAADGGPRGPAVATQAVTTQRPDTFGVNDYTVTSLSALSFIPYDSLTTFATNIADNYRYVTSSDPGRFGVGAEIPAGAIIDFVGIGACDPNGLAFSVDVSEADDAGNSTPFVLFNSNPDSNGPPCGTYYNASPLNHQVLYNQGHSIQVEVIQALLSPRDGSARFSGVEIWWKRTVSPAPATATFNDVPTGHPFFQYIEALAASGITGGCGSGNYCPDQPLTRGQMAVFLAKALGLHWSGLLPQ